MSLSLSLFLSLSLSDTYTLSFLVRSYNHSSTAVINGQTFQEWWLNDYIFNDVGSSKLVNGFYWDDTWYSVSEAAAPDQRGRPRCESMHSASKCCAPANFAGLSRVFSSVFSFNLSRRYVMQGGVGDDPEPGMLDDMGLTKEDVLQLTTDFEANMMALRNRTLKEGKFAWQLMTNEKVGGGPAGCKASLENYCKADAPPQTEAMYYPAAGLAPPAPAAKHPCAFFLRASLY